MAYSISDRIVGLLGCASPVEVARRKQLEEDLRNLATLPGDREFDTLQGWLDVLTLRLGIPRKPEPLDWVLGTHVVLDEPSEREVHEAVDRLATRWASHWRLSDPWLKAGLDDLADSQGVSPSDLKKEVLQTSIIQALQDAREARLTIISRDRAMAFGTMIVLHQEQELEQMMKGEVTDELIDKIGAPSVGVHAISPFRLIGPIEAAFLGYDPREVRPSDLRPSVFYHWARRRSIKHAEEWIREEAGVRGPDEQDALDQGEKMIEVFEPGLHGVSCGFENGRWLRRVRSGSR